MYESVRIQNFRGFADLTVDELTRVNLVVGENNVGKTAVLEAVAILADAPRMQTPRDLEKLRKAPVAGGKTISLFEGLFRDFDASHPITISAQSATRREVASVVVEMAGRTTVSLTEGRGVDLHVPPETDEEMRPLVAPLAGMAPDLVRMELRTGPAATPRSGAAIGVLQRSNPSRLVGVQFDEPAANRPSQFIAVQDVVGLAADPARLTEAIQSGKRDGVVEAMRAVDERVAGLELLDTGAGAGIFVRLAGSTRLMPLGHLGSGAARMLSMVLASFAAEQGVLAVDEIDTGLHYSIQHKVWSAMGSAALEFGVQLFATTHSYECMVAAHEAFADHPEDFSMHRLERGPDGIVRSHDFGHESLGTALELGFEVR
ncbi:AAA family ATPase [bacterium]|nr:AAA family ATPase [bacterium]